LKANLVVMPIKVFDLILGMDWLSRHGARVDYKKKVVQFVRLRWDIMEFKENRIKERNSLIIGTNGLLNKPKDQCTLENTAAVNEFQDVFSAKLTSLPPP
jgi:hypothetical protein